MRLIPFALVVVAVAVQAGTEPSLPEAAASSASSTAVSASAPMASTDGSISVPELHIDWNCGQCKPNEKVPPLILSGYADAAAAGHSGIADGDKVIVTITGYHQRNPALRSLFGFMAGKDELTVSVSWHGKQVTAHDYAANALQGMNAVANSVGKKTFAAVQKLVADEHAGAATAAQ